MRALIVLALAASAVGCTRWSMDHHLNNAYRAYDRGDDMTARDNMLIGSCMAGLAFTNSGLGITHSMAHSLGGLFHIPHGLANAVLLPYVMAFNAPSSFITSLILSICGYSVMVTFSNTFPILEVIFSRSPV